MNFDLFIGIDYSGAKTAASRLPGLQIYAVNSKERQPKKCGPPGAEGRAIGRAGKSPNG